LLRYAPRFHGKNPKTNPPKIKIKKKKKKFQKNFQKKIPKKILNFVPKKTKKLLCINSYACNRGSACEKLGGLGPTGLVGDRECTDST
jgi:hypothetical protein